MRHQVQPWRQPNGHRVDSSRLRALSSLFSHVETKWNEIQVARQGKYSIERLESLDQYCKTTSRTRVVLVCILTPLPALVTALLLELMPLQKPSDGWAKDWVFWIRITILGFITTCAGTFTVKSLVLDLPLTYWKIMAVGAAVAAGSTGFALFLAVFVGFPVPFVLILGNAPSVLIFAVMFVLMFGTESFQSSSPLRPHWAKVRDVVAAHVNLTTIYPLVKILYALVPVQYQGFAMLLLPLWKFGTKKYVGRALDSLEDYVPGFVAFKVDYYCTLFVSVSMFNSGSVMVSVFAIAVDVVLSVLEVRELRANSTIVFSLLQSHKRIQIHSSEDLLKLLLEVIHEPESHGVKSLPNVRLWACKSHSLPTDRLKTLSKLEAVEIYQPRLQPTPVKINSRRFFHTRRISVGTPANGPVSNVIKEKSTELRSTPLTLDVQDSDRSKQLIVQGLQLLFHCEYITLVEYVECIVPVAFLVYKSVLQQLPNVIYAPGGAEAWQTVAVWNIFLFGVLEFLSFVALHALLHRKFAFSPLYQLAFVLETQFDLIQVDLLLATLLLIQFDIQHFGMDFTLRFDYLHTIQNNK